MSVIDFIHKVMLFCWITDASVESWIRTKRHNAAVGGVPHSPHRFGLGADPVFDAPPDEAEVTEIAERLGLTLIHESGGRWHLQPVDWRAG